MSLQGGRVEEGLDGAGGPGRAGALRVATTVCE